MSLSRWLFLIGAMVAVGCLQAAQRHAIVFKGYAVGERLHLAHVQETELEWLSAHVTGLASPAQLSKVAQDRRLALVAWATLGTGSHLLAAVSEQSRPPLWHAGIPPAPSVQVAASPSAAPRDADNDTSD